MVTLPFVETESVVKVMYMYVTLSAYAYFILKPISDESVVLVGVVWLGVVPRAWCWWVWSRLCGASMCYASARVNRLCGDLIGWITFWSDTVCFNC